MFFEGGFHEGSEGGSGVFRMLVHVRPFVNVNTFVKLPLKTEKRYSGKKARGAFFQGSYSQRETRQRQSSAGSGDGGVVSDVTAGSALSSRGGNGGVVVSTAATFSRRTQDIPGFDEESSLLGPHYWTHWEELS